MYIFDKGENYHVLRIIRNALFRDGMTIDLKLIFYYPLRNINKI